MGARPGEGKHQSRGSGDFSMSKLVSWGLRGGGQKNSFFFFGPQRGLEDKKNRGFRFPEVSRRRRRRERKNKYIYMESLVAIFNINPIFDPYLSIPISALS